MPLQTNPPETDLWLPRPSGGEIWDPHTIHTHYFGLSVPEAEIRSGLEGLFDVADGARTFNFGWVWVDGEARHLTRVRRDVARYHPELFAALEQDIEAEDESAATWRFHGRAVAMAHLPSWPNNFSVDSVYRWEDTEGRVAHCTYQEAWYRRFHRAMTVGP